MHELIRNKVTYKYNKKNFDNEDYQRVYFYS